MTITDEQLGRRLRAEVEAIDAPRGVDLAGVRRAGRRRLTRRRGMQAVSGIAVAALVVTGSIVLSPTDRQDITTPATTGTVTPDELERAFTVAVEESGAAITGELDAGSVEDGYTDEMIGWNLSWVTGESPEQRHVLLAINPAPFGDRGRHLCDRTAADLGELIEVRGCETVELAGDRRLVTGEALAAFVHEGGTQRMWAPSAVLTYADGRSIEMMGGQSLSSRDELPPGDVLQVWDGPLTLEQMREIVQRPEWADVPLPD